MSTSMTITNDNTLSTPGEILKEEFMEPYGVSNYRLAKATGLTPTAVGQIVRGERAITVKTAYLLAKAFGTSAEFWLNLQHDYELLSFDSSSLKDVPDLTHCA